LFLHIVKSGIATFHPSGRKKMKEWGMEEKTVLKIMVFFTGFERIS
jgi:hypothetical protein